MSYNICDICPVVTHYNVLDFGHRYRSVFPPQALADRRGSAVPALSRDGAVHHGAPMGFIQMSSHVQSHCGCVLWRLASHISRRKLQIFMF